MAPRHHVLLIGIDAYDGGGSLTGCVNDIDEIQRVLLDRVKVPATQITRLVSPRLDGEHATAVPSEQPTLAALHAALARLADPAVVADGDHVFIYYSGHGTQCRLADAGGWRYAREALLPKDKGDQFTRRFLFDWEINAALATISKVTRRITVIMDCCSSGGAFRDAGDDESEAIYREWDAGDPPAGEVAAGPPMTSLRGITAVVEGLGHCQMIAACRDGQRARESAGEGGKAHGELTRALVAALDRLPDTALPTVRWGWLWRAVEDEVNTSNPAQNPWLFGSYGAQVFGFERDESDAGYEVTRLSDGSYRLDAGRLQGVTAGARIAVYGAEPPLFPPVGSDEDRHWCRGVVEVKSAEAARSTAVAVAPFDLPDGARGRLVAAGEDARLRVQVAAGDAELQAALNAEPLVEVVVTGGEVVALRRPDGWELTDDVHGTDKQAPELFVIPADRADAAAAVFAHYHAYITPVRMARMCRDLPGMLRVRVLQAGGAVVAPDRAQIPSSFKEAPAGARGANYAVTEGEPLCFAVENRATVELSVALLDCAASGRVQYLGDVQVPPRSTQTFWAGSELGKPFYPDVRGGRTAAIDRLVAIGTTDMGANLRALQRFTAFADLLVKLRGVDDPPAATGGPAPVRWTSAMATVLISRAPTSGGAG